MGWVEARNQLITIIEGTTVPTKDYGAGERFHHEKGASREALPSTRGFWIESPSDSVRRLVRNGGTWIQAEVDIFFAYAAGLKPAVRLEVMMRDRAALAPRILDGSQWATSTSTIVKIGHDGGDDLLPATREILEGGALQRLRALLDFIQT